MALALTFRCAAGVSWILLILPACLIAFTTLILGFWAEQPLIYSNRWWWLAVATHLGGAGLLIDWLAQWLRRRARIG